MSRKKVSFSAKPEKNQQIEEWVSSRVEPEQILEPTSEQQPPEEKSKQHELQPEPITEKSEKMKRLTIDIPPDIHRKLKAKAALEGTTIVDMVRPYLEKLVKDL